MTTPERDRAGSEREVPKRPGEATEEVVLLEDLVPRTDVLGGRKIVIGEDTPATGSGPAR